MVFIISMSVLKMKLYEQILKPRSENLSHTTCSNMLENKQITTGMTTYKDLYRLLT